MAMVIFELTRDYVIGGNKWLKGSRAHTTEGWAGTLEARGVGKIVKGKSRGSNTKLVDKQDQGTVGPTDDANGDKDAPAAKSDS